jgi:hypothetical protein
VRGGVSVLFGCCLILVCARERYGVGLGECEYLGAAVIKVGKGILLLRILH